MKPEKLTYLEEGKAVGAHRGFAATFNWLVRFCSNIRGGLGVIVDTTDTDHPVVRMVGNKDELKPFEVRWDAGEECWAVYIPANAVEGVGAFAVHNEKIDGDWYKVANQPSGSGVFLVVAHVKRRVKAGSGDIGVLVHVSATAAGQGVPGIEPANRPRGLDDLRRVYYDAKKMTRRSIGFQASYTVGAQSGAGYYPYVSQTGTSSPVLSSCDAARAIVNWAEIPQAVRDDSRFASAPAFAMVDFWARKTDARGVVSTAQQHLPTTIDANGNAALTGWNADGVLAFLRAKFGQGQSGCTYEAAALLTAVYYDVHYPIDGILAPWHWQPES